MMRFKHSNRGGSPVALPARCATAILIAAFAGGCSAEISRFDFPGFSLTDDKKDQTSSLQTAGAGNRDPDYIGNDGRSTAYDRSGYMPPRSNSESRVAAANLPEPPPSSPNYDARDSRPPYSPPYDSREQRPANDPGTTYRDPPPALRRGESVEIQPGDTLYRLSRRHRVSVAELMEVNGLNNPSLQPGQRIYLPEGYPVRQDPPRQVASVQPPPAPAHIPADLQAKYSGSYTVRSGESVYGISRTYGVPVAELQQANGITDPRGVRVGTVLKVPGGYASETAAPAAPEVADATPVSSSAQEPTVINRRNTLRTAARSDDVATTGAIPAQRSTSAGDKLRWPVNGRIITGFGQRNDGTHNDGINMSVPQGTAVHAAESGVVAYAGSELKGYGNLVLLRHDNGWVTAYAHNDELTVKRGDKVQRGQVIAKAGRTGSVDQPQVHFELRQGSKPVDPVPFLERL